MPPQKDELLKSLARDKAFLAACTVIASEGEEISFADARFASRDKAYSLSWQILNSDGSTNVRFHKLSVDFDGKGQLVYFDDPNCRFVEKNSTVLVNQKLQWPPPWWPSGGGSGSGGGGGFCWFKWSAWVTINQFCGYSFFCFWSNQRATFVTQTRYCMTNPSNVQTQTWKLHCGC
jgi:hypothetical protein